MEIVAHAGKEYSISEYKNVSLIEGMPSLVKIQLYSGSYITQSYQDKKSAQKQFMLLIETKWKKQENIC